MLQRTINIDITLPKSWNQCSIRELETIATVVMAHQAMATSYHPVDQYRVRVDCFFALSGISIIESTTDDSVALDKRCFLCRKKGIKQTFNLYLWQVDSWVNSELKWIGDEHAQGLTLFPYPEYAKRHFLKKHLYDGPATLMQDFSWQRYRFAQDYMEMYLRMSNKFIRMSRQPRKFSMRELKEQQKIVNKAKACFLATIYNGKIRYIDEDTGKWTKDFSFVASQANDNYKDFLHFDAVRWQVVLLWWSGMMQYLRQKFKHCFKRQKPDNNTPSTPLDLYTRTVATMEKYLGLDEKTVNGQNFFVVLQHMEDMAVQNEEMEKIKAKK